VPESGAVSSSAEENGYVPPRNCTATCVNPVLLIDCTAARARSKVVAVANFLEGPLDDLGQLSRSRDRSPPRPPVADLGAVAGTEPAMHRLVEEVRNTSSAFSASKRSMSPSIAEMPRFPSIAPHNPPGSQRCRPPGCSV